MTVRVFPENPGQWMEPEGDLIWFGDNDKITLWRTIETYLDPSQEVLDEICDSDTPYNWNPDTKMVRVMQEVGTYFGSLEEAREELLVLLEC